MNPTCKHRGAIILVLILAGCESDEARDKRIAAEQWVERCRDKASLLATTSGSPSYITCTNQLHRLRVQVATHPSSEEAAAVAFCECERDGGK